MISIPFNLLNSKNKDLLSNITIKEHQNFANDLFNIMNPKDKLNDNSKEIELSSNNIGENLRKNVLNWLFSKLTKEERIKMCTIQNKWLIQILIQMYLLFEHAKGKITFSPNEDMIIFFSELKSLNLLISETSTLSTNDTIKTDNDNKEKEVNLNALNENGKKDKDLNLYNKYFLSKKIKKNKNEEKDKNEEKNKKEKTEKKDKNENKDKNDEFEQYIKIISLDNDEPDTIIISEDLLSNKETFQKYFQIFTNDKYFTDWILPFKNKNGVLNFYMPTWTKYSECFNFYQIIIAFLEQHILLNYEYFYYKNEIYELMYYKKIIELYNESKDLEEKVCNSNYDIHFKLLSKPEISQKIIESVKENDKYIKISKNCINNIYNKIFFENFNYPYTAEIEYYRKDISSDIFKELQDCVKDIKEENKKWEILINKLKFLSFNEIIKSRQFIYLSYKNLLIKNINLKIIKYFDEKKYKEVENIIEENIKDKFDLTFGHYGSYFSECSIEGSDIDICIIYNPKDKNNSDFGNILYQFLINQKSLIFKSNPTKNNNLITITFDIKDKLVKDIIQNNYGYINDGDLTEIKIDISYDNNHNFLKNCENSVNYIKEAIKKYKYIKPVYLYLKRYFKKIGKNKLYYGGISSYSLFLLVLFTMKNIKNDKKKDINETKLLFLVLKKFSKFNFSRKGIDKDNCEYNLPDENLDGTLHILNPLTGLNVANGRLKGGELNFIFEDAFNRLKKKEIICFS